MSIKNIGSNTVPNFIHRTGTDNPFDNIKTGSSVVAPQGLKYGAKLVDIDADSDLDAFMSVSRIVGGSFNDSRVYHENTTIMTSVHNITGTKLSMALSPNPTQGTLQLENPISGTLEVFNLAGQVLQTITLNETQIINIKPLNNGVYFVKIQTEEGSFTKKITFQK